MQKSSSTGISFPRDFLSKIDGERGDVSRSRYLMRMLEKVPQTGPILPRTNQSAEEPNGSDSNG